MESGRPVRLSSSMRSTRRLIGFTEALARLTGVRPGALRARPAFAAACAAVADPSPAAPIRLRAVSGGRRTVGHALADDASVRLLAAAFLRRRTVEAVLEGPLVPRLARSAGIRPPIRRRWSSDPALDARAQAALDDAHLWFGVRCIEAPAGASWVSALVVPQLLRSAACGAATPFDDDAPFDDMDFGDAAVADPAPARPAVAAADVDFGDPMPAARAPAPEPDWVIVRDERDLPRIRRPHPHPALLAGNARAVSVIVVLAGEAIRSLVIRDLTGSSAAEPDADDEEAALADRIGRAVDAWLPPETRPGAPLVVTGFEDGAAPILLSLCGHADLPETIGARLAAALPFQLSRRASSASAVFRRTLPADLSDIAGLVGNRFDGSQQATGFLRLHEGFSPEDNRRVLETLRLMSCLRPFHENPEVLDAIRRGDSLDAVLALALGRPVHRKTVRSMRMRFQGRRVPDPAGETRTVCGRLDAYFASDAHLPALSSDEMRAAYRISGMISGLPYGHFPDAQVAATFRAHHDAKGRLRPPSAGEADLLRWLVDRCRIAFGALRPRGDAYAIPHVHVRQAVAILYPPQRRHAALARLDAEWHRDVVRLTHEHDMLVAELRTARGKRGKAAPSAFPHVAEGPVEIDGVRVSPLVGSEAIASEGRDLQHCIGTYVGRASTGASMLLGLSSGTGRSSVEVVALLGKGRKDAHLAVRQHYGPRNGHPPEGHPEALRAWIAAADPKAVLAAARIAEEASRSEYRPFDPYAGIGDEGRRRVAALCRAQLAPYLSGALKSAAPGDWAAL